MFNRFFLTLVLFAALRLHAQVEGDTTSANSSNDQQMQTPPPVSGQSYPSTYASAERSNYLRAGLSFTTAYSDNITGGTNPRSDIIYSFSPSIVLYEATPRTHLVFSYSPGFTIYQHTSSLDQANHNFSINLQYRFSPHVTLSLRDNLFKTSNVFYQPDETSAGVPGSAQAPAVAIIAPAADQLSNTSNATLTYQFSPSSMVGVGGTFSNLHYLSQVQSTGLGDSNSYGGSAFYSRRLSRKQYVGGQYQYQKYLSYPTTGQYETQTHTIYLFYTVYLKPTFSISFSGGPQYLNAPQPPLPNSHSWNPAASASFGWQAHHTNIAGNYSRVVSGGGGLIGAFFSNTSSLSVRQQLARTWNVGAAAAYSEYKNVTEFSFFASPGGHSISGSASLQHTFKQNLSASLAYTRLHQSYGGIAVIANAPDTNIESISLAYQFSRPIGR